MILVKVKSHKMIKILVVSTAHVITVFVYKVTNIIKSFFWTRVLLFILRLGFSTWTLFFPNRTHLYLLFSFFFSTFTSLQVYWILKVYLLKGREEQSKNHVEFASSFFCWTVAPHSKWKSTAMRLIRKKLVLFYVPRNEKAQTARAISLKK